MNVAIIGIGLIGGSMALALKESSLAETVIGVDNNPEHTAVALERKLVHEIASLEEAVAKADLVILAIPVDAMETVLPQVLNLIDDQIVVEAGSTKSKIIELVKNHPKRAQFVATHPMWGPEYSGPEAAVRGAFQDKAVVVCNKEESSEKAITLVVEFYTMLGMHIVFMDATAHDVHAAYVSHVSHITSFALANTVLEKEREESAIFELASGGFESTVRLAKSNPAMWVPIFMQNRENVLDVLNEHISQLRKFKACLEKENYEYLSELIQNANKIKRIIK
ncbi:MAG TPA: prephenate dehydrogenase [Chitinophagaceae bacterium]|nr:prephenate dehydrogenase [Chitinophagaceae bacterium]